MATDNGNSSNSALTRSCEEKLVLLLVVHNFNQKWT
jgi:hypothetical protein